MRHLGAILAHLGAILAHLGAILAQLGAVLGNVEAIFAHPEAILAHLGAVLAHLGTILRPSWGDLGLSWEPSWFMLAPRLAKIGRRQVEIRPKTDPREFKHSLQHHNGPSAFWNNSPTFFFVFLSTSEGRGGILGHLRTMWGLSWAYLGLS